MVSGSELGLGHGKIILLGEHSVVYGRPAIAAGFTPGCSASAETHTVDTLSVEPWGVQVEAARSEADAERELLRRAFAEICDHYHAPRAALHVRAHLQIPSGAGLGGSAALSVAILRAMDAQLSRTSNHDELLAASMAWERVFHGNPSGIDSAMAISGGLALYRRGEPLEPIRMSRTVRLIVANSGERASTKDMVASVARQHERSRALAEQRFDAIAALVMNGRTALKTGDHKSLGQLMDLNQALLNAFLLSTNKLEHMCRLARSSGALGAKLTGSGGGGCIIALAPDPQVGQDITRALRDGGFEAFSVEVTA